jgi:hypothetical protein
MVFKIFDMTADGGLRQMYGLTGFGKAFELDHLAVNV